MDYVTALDNFITYLKFERESSSHTLSAYRRDILDFIDFLNVNTDLEIIDVKKSICKDYVHHLYTIKNYKGNTVRRKIYAVNSFYNFLLDEEIISENPFRKVRLPNKRRNIPVFLTTQELDKLIFTAERHPNKTSGMRDLICISILRYTGCRRNELLNLKWKHINFIDGSIKFTGKGNKERLVPIHPKLMKYLQKYNLQSESNWEGYIVKGQKNNKLSNSSLKKITEKYLVFSGLSNKSITPHKIRHSFASELLRNGVDIRLIQQWLGHEEITTTAIYTHVTFDQLKNVWSDEV
ncbi:tyrosine-type recombinase/integrase [Metabacillus sp. cB07]|uniref:tyrosine-type recombinase/integrase n=1 Tax=Metabacillus sp. cB07 TaxID=2806989 RepID=UPI001939B4E2|nr:tyrosine-type recombinase/integrase [Metabacillus sp. cB07]